MPSPDTRQCNLLACAAANVSCADHRQPIHLRIHRLETCEAYAASAQIQQRSRAPTRVHRVMDIVTAELSNNAS